MFQSLLKRGVHAGADAFGLRSFASSNNLALIKELREKSQAPMNDVRNALMESQWDMGERNRKYSVLFFQIHQHNFFELFVPLIF